MVSNGEYHVITPAKVPKIKIKIFVSINKTHLCLPTARLIEDAQPDKNPYEAITIIYAT